jgi:oligopeptide transport system substrate-binding protein
VSWSWYVLRASLCVWALSFVVITLTPSVATGAPVVLRKGNGSEPATIDPALATGEIERNVINSLFEGLIQKDPAGKNVPGVALTWDESKDRLTYTFHLRKNAKWSNGDPVTAGDFVYSWRRLLDPKTASSYAYQGFYIKGAKAFNSGKEKDPNTIGVKALDPHTLQVTLEEPTPFFIGLLFHYSLYPVHQATVEKFGDRWTRPENIVSNGAFVLDKWEVNRLIRVKKSPTYWDTAIVKLDAVEFYPVENLDTEEKMFRTKQLDITMRLPIEKVPFWKKDKSGVFQSDRILATYLYRLNVKKKPLDDKRVRQALSYAIDRKRIVELVTRGNETPATAWTPPGTGGGYDPGEILPSDGRRIPEAKKLLAAAGYPNGKGMPEIEILYNTAENHRKIAEAVQQMWKQNLGIEVKLFNQEWKVYLDSMKTGNYTVARYTWNADYNDPNTFLDMWMTKSTLNETNWGNAKYDELIVAASKESNPAKRMKHFKDAEAILLDEMPIIPVYFWSVNYLKSPQVKNYVGNLEDDHALKWVSKE